MLPKLTRESIPFEFSPVVVVKMLMHITTNTCYSLSTTYFNKQSLISYDVIVKIELGKIIVEYDTYSVSISCSHEWVQVMHKLNNVSDNIKCLMLRALKLFPEKMLLIIHLLMFPQQIFSIYDIIFPHHDISSSLLNTFFNNVGHTYTIHTYIDNDHGPEFKLYFEKFCGYEHNPYCISKYLIKYFDNVHHLSDKDFHCEYAINMGLCQLRGSIDPELRTYILCMNNITKHIIVSQTHNSFVSLLIYYINVDMSKRYVSERYISSYMNRLYTDTGFYDYIKKLNNGIPIKAQIHHIIKDGKFV